MRLFGICDLGRAELAFEVGSFFSVRRLIAVSCLYSR